MPRTAGGGQHPRASSRRRVLDLLRYAGRPMDLAELSEATGLHPNTLRGHLDLLVDLGQVQRTVAERTTPGRPRVLYASRDGEPAANPYRLLATELAAGLATGADAIDAGRAAGRHWAERLRRQAGLDASEEPDADRVVALAAEGLSHLGFTAQTEPLGDRIYLRSCPFEELARTNPSVCRVHADLLTGLFDELGGAVQLEGLDPFVRPDLCIARLARRDPPPLTTEENLP
jgi:predicted ArsR family transcriptional regulator